MSDLIRRRDAIYAIIDELMPSTPLSAVIRAKSRFKDLPAVQPETATVTIGRTKGGVPMWYECDACGEPINQKDCYCRNCGRKLTLPEPYRGGEE